MTYRDALATAAKNAKKRKDWRYVIVDCGEYEVASEYDLDTFYQGCTQILTVFGPDGQQEIGG